jgi:hypothetical protein
MRLVAKRTAVTAAPSTRRGAAGEPVERPADRDDADDAASDDVVGSPQESTMSNPNVQILPLLPLPQLRCHDVPVKLNDLPKTCSTPQSSVPH